MEFGMFHEFARMPGQSEAETFAASFEEVDAAERWGLDVMWLAELHVDPTRSVLAAPLTIASAIAARTRRMKIGIAVQVLPLCHPLRLAEEVTTVDHISHGRLIMGVGRSGFARTYEAYGISYAESRERFAEVLEILRRAFTRETFSFSGGILQLRKYLFGAEAVSIAVSGDPHCGNQSRYVCGDRGAGVSDILCDTAGRFVGVGPPGAGVSGGLGGGGASGAGPDLFAGAGLCGGDGGTCSGGAGGECDAFLSRAGAAD